MYIFNMEKNNRLTDIYGADVEVIDKTPPVIDLLKMNLYSMKIPQWVKCTVRII